MAGGAGLLIGVLAIGGAIAAAAFAPKPPQLPAVPTAPPPVPYTPQQIQQAPETKESTAAEMRAKITEQASIDRQRRIATASGARTNILGEEIDDNLIKVKTLLGQ